MTIKVVSDVPVPTIGGRGRPSIYPWATMNVGDSVLIADRHQIARVSASQWKIRYPGWNYTTRLGPDGLRVWRTA